MMNHNRSLKFASACFLAGSAMLVMLSGCGGEEEAPVVAQPTPPPAPPPPPEPTVTLIADLMAELNIDPRVVLPEDRAPASNEERKAVLVFFDSFARGNSKALESMLPLSDQLELKALVDSGDWQRTVAQIKRIEIQTGANDLSQKCALAVAEVGSGGATNFQPQLWYYTIEQENSVFEAAPTPPGILDKLSGDWISAWHKILAAELELAQQPDEDVEIQQQNIDTGSDQSQSSGGGPESPNPPGGRRIREPTGPPTPAP